LEKGDSVKLKGMPRSELYHTQRRLAKEIRQLKQAMSFLEETLKKKRADLSQVKYRREWLQAQQETET